MTGSVGSKHCQYCWCPVAGGPQVINGRRVGSVAHSDGCPTLDLTGGQMAEWNRGYNYGFDDHFIHWWQYRRHTSSFIFGWRAGKAEIDRLVEGAFYSNYGYELDEED